MSVLVSAARTAYISVQGAVFVCMAVFMLVRMTMLMRMSMLVDVFMLVNVRMPVMFMTVLVFTLSVMMSAGAFSFMLMFFHNKTSNLATVCENKLRTAEYCCIFQASFSAAAVLFPDVIQSLIQN